MIMLGLLLRAAFIAATTAATVAVVTALVIHIHGKITEKKLKKKLAAENIKSSLVQEINRCSNCISLQDLETGRPIEVHGSRIDDDIWEGERIYV